jgi:hypothetical protein
MSSYKTKCLPKPNTWTRSSVRQSKPGNQHEQVGLPDLRKVMKTSHSLPERTEKTKQNKLAAILPYLPQLAIHLSQSLQCHCVSINYIHSFLHSFISSFLPLICSAFLTSDWLYISFCTLPSYCLTTTMT